QMERTGTFLRRTVATFLFLILLVASSRAQSAQEKASTSCNLPEGKSIRTAYLSPSAQGRKIFGGQVPYGKVWPVGGKPAATFETDSDLTVEGQDLPAGSYALFVVPAEDRWTLIISKLNKQSPSYAEDDEALRVRMRVAKSERHIEKLVIAYQSE